jgi:hypothetical protein
MWRWSALIVLGALLQACLYVPPVWDIGDAIYSADSIKEGITTKQEVLKVLGEPHAQWKENGNDVFSYEGETSNGFLFIGGPGPGCCWVEFMDEEHWWIRIEFDENDIVETFLTSEKTRPQQAQYELGNTLRLMGELAEARKWWCMAANQSHGKAQERIGDEYRYGRVTDGEPDYVRAYMWYDLAASNGSIQAFPNKVNAAGKMTPEQIAEAERLAREWESGPCEPEVSATTSAN